MVVGGKGALPKMFQVTRGRGCGSGSSCSGEYLAGRGVKRVCGCGAGAWLGALNPPIGRSVEPGRDERLWADRGETAARVDWGFARVGLCGGRAGDGDGDTEFLGVADLHLVPFGIEDDLDRFGFGAKNLQQRFLEHLAGMEGRADLLHERVLGVECHANGLGPAAKDRCHQANLPGFELVDAGAVGDVCEFGLPGFGGAKSFEKDNQSYNASDSDEHSQEHDNFAQHDPPKRVSLMSVEMFARTKLTKRRCGGYGEP